MTTRIEDTLTEAARRMLIGARHYGQGARVHGDQVVVTELFDAGLVGIGDGLTRQGTIVRERLVRALEDSMFG